MGGGGGWVGGWVGRWVGVGLKNIGIRLNSDLSASLIQLFPRNELLYWVRLVCNWKRQVFSHFSWILGKRVGYRQSL